MLVAPKLDFLLNYFVIDIRLKIGKADFLIKDKA